MTIVRNTKLSFVCVILISIFQEIATNGARFFYQPDPTARYRVLLLFHLSFSPSILLSLCSFLALLTRRFFHIIDRYFISPSIADGLLRCLCHFRPIFCAFVVTRFFISTLGKYFVAQTKILF